MKDVGDVGPVVFSRKLLRSRPSALPIPARSDFPRTCLSPFGLQHDLDLSLEIDRQIETSPPPSRNFPGQVVKLCWDVQRQAIIDRVILAQGSRE